MDSLKKFTIELTNVELFQKCLSISTALHANKIINLIIDNDTISSTTSDAVDSCYKHWLTKTDKIGIVATTNEMLMQPIKCSIYKGVEFASKILNQLSAKETTSTITFFYDEMFSHVKQIECINSNKAGKKIFSFKFKTSDVSLIFTDFDKETIEFFFTNESPANKLYEFKLIKEDLKNLQSLLNLNIHDDAQNNYISIKLLHDSNQISFTDEITDFRLNDNSVSQIISEELSKTIFNIDKQVFKTIDISDYICQLREANGTKFITLFNINDNITYVIAIPLLESISSTISYEDILKDTGKFG